MNFLFYYTMILNKKSRLNVKEFDETSWGMKTEQTLCNESKSTVKIF